ncbi:MAG: hypothetical protein M1812_004655 [Candelaria pacifica]|nr:MAG: hypothetical protein M1812_004655 [Candelaria pacifica]
MSATETATAVQPELSRALAVTPAFHIESMSGGAEHAIEVLICHYDKVPKRINQFGPLYGDWLRNIQATYDVQIVHTIEDTLEYMSFSPAPRAILLPIDMNCIHQNKDLRSALKKFVFGGGTFLLCSHFDRLQHWEYDNVAFRGLLGIPWTHAEYTRTMTSLRTMKPLFGHDLSQTLRKPNIWERIYVMGAAAETDIYLVNGKMPHRAGPPESLPGSWINRTGGPQSRFYPNKFAAQIKFDSLHHPALFGRFGRGFIGYVGEFHREAGVEALTMKMLDYGLSRSPKPTTARSCEEGKSNVNVSGRDVEEIEKSSKSFGATSDRSILSPIALLAASESLHEPNSAVLDKGRNVDAMMICGKESETNSPGTESSKSTFSSSNSSTSSPTEQDLKRKPASTLHATNGVKELCINPDKELNLVDMPESHFDDDQGFLLDLNPTVRREESGILRPTPQYCLHTDPWVNTRAWPWMPVGEKPAPRDLLLCKSHRETFCRLIDIFRLRVEENLNIAKEMIGKYGMDNERPPFLEFKRFLQKAEDKRLLPYWWDSESGKECRFIAMNKSHGCWIGDSVDEDDIRKKYAEMEMSRWMRVFATNIYGRKVESPLAHM